MLDPEPRLLCRSRYTIDNPAVAFGAGNYLVVWNGMAEPSEIHGCRIRRDGTVLDSGGFTIVSGPGASFDPALDFDGERFLVVWTASQSGDFDIFAAFVDTSPQVGLEDVRPTPGKGGLDVRLRPGPGRSAATVSFFLPTEDRARLDFYNCAGRLVRSLRLGRLCDGFHEVVWDGDNETGSQVPAGTYFCRLTCGGLSTFGRVTRW
jgi:hypothetical protein